MIKSSYDGFVQMKPNLENAHVFFGDDDFSYQIPRVYHEHWGEIYDSQSDLDWSDSSIITFKDNCAVKYNADLVKNNSNSLWCKHSIFSKPSIKN